MRWPEQVQSERPGRSKRGCRKVRGGVGRRAVPHQAWGHRDMLERRRRAVAFRQPAVRPIWNRDDVDLWSQSSCRASFPRASLNRAIDRNQQKSLTTNVKAFSTSADVDRKSQAGDSTAWKILKGPNILLAQIEYSQFTDEIETWQLGKDHPPTWALIFSAIFPLGATPTNFSTISPPLKSSTVGIALMR